MTESVGEPRLPSPKERRRLREAAGLTYEDVATAVGVTVSTVRSWETGSTDPRGPKREAYADLLTALRPPAPPAPAPAPQPPPLAGPAGTADAVTPPQAQAAPAATGTPPGSEAGDHATACAGPPAAERPAPVRATGLAGPEAADTPPGATPSVPAGAQDTTPAAPASPPGSAGASDAASSAGGRVAPADTHPWGSARETGLRAGADADADATDAVAGGTAGRDGAARSGPEPAPAPTTPEGQEPTHTSGATATGPEGSGQTPGADTAPHPEDSEPTPADATAVGTHGPAPAPAGNTAAHPEGDGRASGDVAGHGPGGAGADPERRNGPRGVFDALYEYAAPALTRQAYLLTGRRRLAQEAVERAFQQAWARWPEVATDPDPVGWVRAAAYEYALSPWHRFRRAHKHPDKAPAAPADRILMDAMLALPPAHRRTVLLYDGVALDLPDAAAETEASTPTAGNRLLHAHAALADRVPELAAAPSEKRSALLRELLGAVKPAVPLEPRSAVSVRVAAERRTHGWTRAVLGLSAVIAVATAYTTATAPRQYEPPVPLGASVSGVPPLSGPQRPTQQTRQLHDKLRAHPAHGPARIAPKPE
ncbi:helix-turn-helix domain-containing protein [Streptomyces sp. NPDC050448]|uniref:helix-turn-helix domain-containing protein n=1 Tax=Streptomyces sp. NPDC050448 TaxID=3155404 RepID=UPI0034234C3F